MASPALPFRELYSEGNVIKVIYQDTSVIGIVWSLDEESGLLVLQQVSPTGEVEVCVINTASITSVSLVPAEELPKKPLKIVKLDPVDVVLARKSEEKKVNHEKVKASGIGQNVTKEAQAIFNALTHFNFPCSWDNQDIVINSAHVRIQPPYGPENCVSTSESKNSGALQRIQKFVAAQKKQ